ncbi:MAG: PilZ domain-containing protein [Gammaproteobacteria bacterium]|nr:MAG: PilZ domain-containing protein [Gammaproteobacteria bacterium]
MSAQAAADFEGISLFERLPFAWSAADLGDLNQLDHANHETARALQALAVYEEAPREAASDASHHAMPELLHLQVKVDVLLSLVGRLIADQSGLPPRHSVVLRGQSVEWSGPDHAKARPGDSGYALIYANPMLPLPLRLPGRVVGSVERAGSRWLQTRFEHLTPAVAAGLEKMVFRRHRRQVAFSKGTGVFTETGVFRTSKF